jgi:hypothetical protein
MNIGNRSGWNIGKGIEQRKIKERKRRIEEYSIRYNNSIYHLMSNQNTTQKLNQYTPQNLNQYTSTHHTSTIHSDRTCGVELSGTSVEYK